MVKMTSLPGDIALTLWMTLYLVWCVFVIIWGLKFFKEEEE